MSRFFIIAIIAILHKYNIGRVQWNFETQNMRVIVKYWVFALYRED